MCIIQTLIWLFKYLVVASDSLLSEVPAAGDLLPGLTISIT